jgi:hypothetical protein
VYGEALAAAYLVAVTVLTILEHIDVLSLGALDSSAAAVGRGEVWRLVTSSLVVEGPAAPQIALTALVVATVIRLEGSFVWWCAAVIGHVGSAAIAYAVIGLAIALGSASADAAADNDDFGISCVLGASLGALLGSGIIRRDRTLVAIALFGLVVLLPFSLDWYGPEHPLSFALGAAVTAIIAGRDVRRPDPRT